MRKAILTSAFVLTAAWLGFAAVPEAEAAGLANMSLAPSLSLSSGVMPVHSYWKGGCHYHPGERYCVRYDSYGNCTKWGHRHYCHQHGGSSGGGGSGY